MVSLPSGLGLPILPFSRSATPQSQFQMILSQRLLVVELAFRMLAIAPLLPQSPAVDVRISS